MKLHFLALLMVLLSVGAVGCRGRGEVKSVTRNDDGSLEIVVAYSEEDFNDMIAAALEMGGNPLLRDPEVDLQNGQVLITGSHDSRVDPNTRVAGSMTATVTVQNGVLFFQVVAADLDGVGVEDARIQAFNQRMVDSMMRRASAEGRVSEVLAVSISDAEAEITIRREGRRNAS